MPIKFRCPHCQQFLGISRSKASTLTDCPTCGRTLRVPALDGTVAPVPSPKLNLEDSELRNALGALASLEGDQEDQIEEEEKTPSAVFKPSLHQEEDSVPAIVAEPIPQAEANSNQDEIIDSPSPLSELADAEYAIPIVEPELDTRQRLIWIISLVVVGIMLFLIGFFCGRYTGPGDSSGVPQEDEQRAAVEVNIPDENEAPKNVNELLSGTILYETKSGEMRADNGARVLILPIPNSDDVKLSAEGFRIGAAKADQDQLAEKVAEIGGILELADRQGDYTVSGLSPGKYKILIGSRFQSRDELQPVPENVTTLIGNYFENPARVLGQVQYYYQEIELNNEPEAETLVVDHSFKLE
ncbi:hypothetical protein N9153_01120 [Planctomicrobium sp.]|jgi:hypothetical protein|nr:hypothetical protein [Planctomicrobium sp.]